ncbi:MAG: ERCC4 domain-containing protein [Nanoarchaeota archaeon]
MTFFNIFSKQKIVEKGVVKIIVDNREKNSLVISELVKRGFAVEFEQLDVGDYIVNGVAVERKTISDLKSSIVDKRIISQLNELKQYPKHLLIVEGFGGGDIYSEGIHENAFRGFLLSVAFNFKTPMIFSIDEEDTAKYLSVIARKNDKNENPIRASKILLSDKEQLQFIIEGFPEIGPATAKKLMNEFSNLKEVANASKEQLEKVIGKKSQHFYNLINEPFR